MLIVFVSFTILGWLRFESYNLTEKIPEILIYKELDLKLKIIDDFRSSENFYKYKAEIISIDTFDFKNAYVLLYVRKNNEKLYSDDEIWVQSALLNNQKPLNFHQFDYSKYLERKKFIIRFLSILFRIEKRAEIPSIISLQNSKTIFTKNS